jgi:hypothetical protein
MNLKESIKRILREETDIPLKIRRRILPKLIENAFQTALDGNTMLKTKPGSMLHKASFITFANFVIDDMVEYMEDQINMDGNSYYYGNDDAYIEEVRNPLLKHYGDRIKKRYDDIVGGDVFESVLEETNIPLQVKRRINGDSLAELIHDIKSLIDSGYDESDAIYDTVRQFIASKQFKLNNDSEQSYWDSYIEVEEPLVDYLKSKLNIRESVLREETEEYKVKLVTNIIYTLYDNISFIKQSTFNGKPLLIIYFDSDDTAANIESWFDEKISRDIEEWTSGNIVVCPDWIFNWDSRKKNADVFINTELIKYDNLGNVVNESILREEMSSMMRRIFRRVDPEKMDGIFGEGLDTMTTRYIQNQHNWHAMNLDKFKSGIVSYVIVDLCMKYSDVCFGAGDFYNQVWEFLLSHYSDVMEERWNEIMSGEVNESVLKEDRKAKETISDLVKEFGLIKTSDMVGLSISQIVKVTNIPIDSDTANQILVEMMNNDELKTKYKDFNIHASSNDVFYWEAMVKTGHFHDDMIENITVAATPFWDGVKYTPVEIEWYTLLNYYGVTVYETSGEGNFYKELKHQTNFESVDELLNWYEEFYLPEVYNMVMNTLLPKMHKLVDYEIKQRG